MKIAIIGAGWAGMAAAVQVMGSGHSATVFEASRSIGGRARAVNATLPDGSRATLDNGQHVLIGAYTETLGLMRRVGVNLGDALLRLPLSVKFPDGAGLQLPQWPPPLDSLAGILGANGWSLRDKASLLQAAVRWRCTSFRCGSTQSVADICQRLTPRVMAELIEPLCVSALNTPAKRASGQVFLHVLRDALFGARGSSNLLLPRVDLSQLFPQAAADWIARHSARGGAGKLKLGARVDYVRNGAPTCLWQVNGEGFDTVILAVSSPDAVRALVNIELYASKEIAVQTQEWIQIASALRFEAITTVYAWGAGAALASPILALRSQANASGPAQFVFDRGQLGGAKGLLAFVVSASTGERDAIQAGVLVQASRQLGLTMQPVQTIVEKQATFACTPGLQRPPLKIAAGLLACGDYVDSPYPATLEGAVRSGIAAANIAMGLSIGHVSDPAGDMDYVADRA